MLDVCFMFALCVMPETHLFTPGIPFEYFPVAATLRLNYVRGKCQFIEVSFSTGPFDMDFLLTGEFSGGIFLSVDQLNRKMSLSGYTLTGVMFVKPAGDVVSYTGVVPTICEQKDVDRNHCSNLMFIHNCVS